MQQLPWSSSCSACPAGIWCERVKRHSYFIVIHSFHIFVMCTYVKSMICHNRGTVLNIKWRLSYPCFPVRLFTLFFLAFPVGMTALENLARQVAPTAKFPQNHLVRPWFNCTAATQSMPENNIIQLHQDNSSQYATRSQITIDEWFLVCMPSGQSDKRPIYNTACYQATRRLA